jgi:hypothetical protein
VAVIAVAGTVAGTVIGVAQASPRLPGRTAAQLIAALADSSPPPLTGTVVETTSLGLPQLPGSMDPSSVTSLLAGSHTVKVWYGGPGQIRLAVPVQMGETDLIQDKGTVWLWQSGQNSATKLALPRETGREPAPKVHLMPQQAAQQALKLVGKTTRVSTEANVDVAGEAAYQLVVAPRDSRSLVGKVTIAIDGQHPAVVLRVQVFARGARGPAFQVGYTNVNFVRPGAANFNFTPPRGAHVTTLPGSGNCALSVPAGAIRSAVGRSVRAQMALPKGVKPQPRCGVPVGVPPMGLAPATTAPQVIGQGWTTVVALPSSVLGGIGGMGAVAKGVGQSIGSLAGNGQAQARAQSGGNGPVPAGGGIGSGAVLAALLASAHTVHGHWGSGRLITTSLLSVLITSNGHVLLGAVQPSVLYAAASHLK